MSQRAYRLAVRDKLQNLFNLDANSCETGFDGQPKPSCGELYIAVHSGPWSGTSADYDLTEIVGLLVTVTMRIAKVPQDRYGPSILDQALTGLEALEPHAHRPGLRRHGQSPGPN